MISSEEYELRKFFKRAIDLWVSNDSGATWKHRWQFDRGDLISFVIDPLNPQHLYAGFFQPGNVRESTDGGNSWHALTE